MAEQVEPEQGWRGVRVDAEGLDVDGVHSEHVAVGAVAGGRGGADIAGGAGVTAQRDRRWGRSELSGAPAPVGSSLTSGGMSAMAQCQNPLPVGASGSKHVTAKLLVSAGKPDQESCGEMSSPPAPKTPETCGSAIG